MWTDLGVWFCYVLFGIVVPGLGSVAVSNVFQWKKERCLSVATICSAIGSGAVWWISIDRFHTHPYPAALNGLELIWQVPALILGIYLSDLLCRRYWSAG